MAATGDQAKMPYEVLRFDVEQLGKAIIAEYSKLEGFTAQDEFRTMFEPLIESPMRPGTEHKEPMDGQSAVC